MKAVRSFLAKKGEKKGKKNINCALYYSEFSMR